MPDYLRTKPEPEVEEKVQLLSVKASSITPEMAQVGLTYTIIDNTLVVFRFLLPVTTIFMIILVDYVHVHRVIKWTEEWLSVEDLLCRKLDKILLEIAAKNKRWQFVKNYM